MVAIIDKLVAWQITQFIQILNTDYILKRIRAGFKSKVGGPA